MNKTNIINKNNIYNNNNNNNNITCIRMITLWHLKQGFRAFSNPLLINVPEKWVFTNHVPESEFD